MEKEEILAKAQQEGHQADVADLDAQRKGAWVAYTLGIIGIILVDVVNGIVFHYVNHGPNMVLAAMSFTAFLVKYVHLKKKHELIVALCYGALTVMFLVFWILQLTKVW